MNKQTILKTKTSLSVPVVDSCHLTSNKTTGRDQGNRNGSNQGQDGVRVNGEGCIKEEEESGCDALELFEWLGAVSCGVEW